MVLTVLTRTGRMVEGDSHEGHNMGIEGWCNLNTRYGGGSDNPCHDDLVNAARELYDENITGMHEGDYAEHPNAWLTLGYDNGPMYVIDAYRKGMVILSKFNDQDDDEPVAESREEKVSEDTLVEVWTWLLERDIERIRATFPACGW